MKTLLFSALFLTMVVFINGVGSLTPFNTTQVSMQSQDGGGEDTMPEPEPTPEPEQ